MNVHTSPFVLKTQSRPVRLCVVGAAPDTGNRGVSALAASVLGGIARCAPDAEVTLFDHGRGRREGLGLLESVAPELRAARVGCANTRRVYREESLRRASGARWGLGRSPIVDAIRASDAVLDVSGGDSFTDLYGGHRFETITRPKLLTIQLGRPLILLPQTYGPFTSRRARQRATFILRSAAQAWARDAQSLEVMKHLLGSAFDRERHQLAVDLAFALPASRRPVEDERVRNAIGLNVSGLLFNAEPETVRERFGFKADYREAIGGILRRLIDETREQIVLVPHVNCGASHPESDVLACERLVEGLEADMRGRVLVADPELDQSELKRLISQLDWLCSTRMHAAIAGLSTGVPTAAIAYSDKTRGVFATCGQARSVVDPRFLSTVEVVERVWRQYERRGQTRRTLAFAMPSVVRSAEVCLDQILRDVAWSIGFESQRKAA